MTSSSSEENKTSFTKAASAPLLTVNEGSEGPLSPPPTPTAGPGAEDSSSEMNLISWGRAIGVCNLYVVWLILDLVGLWGDFFFNQIKTHE